MLTITELCTAVSSLNVFQLQELDRVVRAQMFKFGAPDRSTPAVPRTGASLSKFKVGDLVEFYSKTKGANVMVRVEKINSVNLSARTVESPFLRWRVAPSLCRLVGAGKMEVPEVLPAMSRTLEPSLGARASTPGAGGW